MAIYETISEEFEREDDEELEEAGENGEIETEEEVTED